jgi:starch synthase
MNLDYKEDVPLIGIVSRLAIQKGFDLIASSLNELMKLDAQWVILGSGEYKYEHLFNEFAASFSDKFSVYIGFNNELAHLIEAGADIFLMPSHYEPCGLNQIYSLKYGTVPVVRKTGGLADTVQDWDENKAFDENLGNGFSFHDYSSPALLDAVQRAVNYYHNKDVWQKIQLNGMRRDYSWSKSAKKYQELYHKALSRVKG